MCKLFHFHRQVAFVLASWHVGEFTVNEVVPVLIYCCYLTAFTFVCLLCPPHMSVRRAQQRCVTAYFTDHFTARWILSGTTRVSRYQKGKTKTSLDFLEQETVNGSGISWAICKSAPRPRETTTPVPQHSVFTGRVLFLPPNQQRQSTEGNHRV